MNHLFDSEFNSNSSNKLYVTEGEFDAESYQILGQKFFVKSPSASIGEKFIKQNYNYLNSFKEIIYAGELDDAGRRSAERLYESFPPSCTMYQCQSTKMLMSFSWQVMERS